MEDSFTDKFKPVKLYFECVSSKEADESSLYPIILVHGLFADYTTWNKVKTKLSDKTKRKVYSIGLRNHDRSDSSEDFSLMHMTSDLLQFMLDQNIPRAILVGHSLGGRAAIQLAFLKPEMVEMVITEDTFISDPVGETVELHHFLLSLAQKVYEMLKKLPSSMSERDAQKMISQIVSKNLSKFINTPGISEQSPKHIPVCKDKVTGEFKLFGNFKSLIDSLKNPKSLAIDLTNSPIYTGKALLTKGEFSPIILEEDSALIKKHMPQAEFKHISKSHHTSHSDNPEEFISVVTNFILSS